VVIYSAGLEGVGVAAGTAGFAASFFDSAAGLSAADDDDDDDEDVFDAGFEPLFLKSVAYQPLPFNWKPAAVTILVKAGLPHFVHTVRGASLTFCRNSCWCPQLSQRYS
jgi:hypothetical protein